MIRRLFRRRRVIRQLEALGYHVIRGIAAADGGPYRFYGLVRKEDAEAAYRAEERGGEPIPLPVEEIADFEGLQAFLARAKAVLS